MNATDFLALLDTKGIDYRNISRELGRRCHSLGLIDCAIAFSCLHNEGDYVLYDADQSIEIIQQSEDRWDHYFGPREHCSWKSIIIDLSYLNEGKNVLSKVYVAGRHNAGAPHASIDEICAILTDFCIRAVQRHRAMIRRMFIEAKIGSDDLGTFCYRLLDEAFSSIMAVGATSIFILDKTNGELRLRGQVPKRDDRRHLTDVSINPQNSSWIARCFKTGIPCSEYNIEGLKRGKTIENHAIKYVSRIYWPIQLQFKTRAELQRREKDPVIGVVRISNPTDMNGQKPRPFHCFDGFSIDFLSECLHMLVSSFVDRDVEGFDRDLAFHAAKTPATGCLRNIRLAAQFLFEPDEVNFLDARPGAVPPQFTLKESGVFKRIELIRAINNAYGFALDLASQVERANITEEFHPDLGRRVDRLFSDVIQRAVNLAPYFEISHSGSHHFSGTPRLSTNRIFDLELPPPVVGDEGALTSVFKNIIENSIKYSRRDEGAKLEISWRDENHHICIVLRDFGIGIPKEDTERIFTRGVRSERAKAHSVRGNGLGLAYCSRIVRSFGGSIKAKALDDGLEIQVRLKKAK
jgi:hypothetical protein